MIRHRVALVTVALSATLVAGCSAFTAPVATGPSTPVPLSSSVLPSPSPSPSASPLPSASAPPAAPSPSPTATPTSPGKPPASKKPKPKPTTAGAPGTVDAADLGIPGAGTLKIPAWPDTPGFRWRGPDGSQGSTGTASVALTFDDGPGPYTSQILDVLDEYHVKATFCIIGRQVSAYGSVILRMIKDGMTLCDHTWDHNEQLSRLGAHAIAEDMQKTIDAIHKVDPSAQVTYFRNPGGNFSPGTVRISELLGMRPLYWTEDTDDWKMPGVAAIEKTVRTKTHPDSIVLMHDAGGNRSETVAALKVLLPELVAKYHLIALPAARTVYVDPGPPTPTAADRPVLDSDLPR